MLRVYSCIVQEHDLRLVVVAGIICLLASSIALSSFDQFLRADTLANGSTRTSPLTAR